MKTPRATCPRIPATLSEPGGSTAKRARSPLCRVRSKINAGATCVSFSLRETCADYSSRPRRIHPRSSSRVLVSPIQPSYGPAVSVGPEGRQRGRGRWRHGRIEGRGGYQETSGWRQGWRYWRRRRQDRGQRYRCGCGVQGRARRRGGTQRVQGGE